MRHPFVRLPTLHHPSAAYGGNSFKPKSPIRSARVCAVRLTVLGPLLCNHH